MAKKLAGKKNRTNRPGPNAKKNKAIEETRGKGSVKNLAAYVAFQEWSALSDKERAEVGLSTHGKFAEKWGLDQNTLTDWKRRTDFAPKVFEKTKKWGQEKWPNVLEGLYNRSAKGYAMEVELFAMIVFGWTRERAKEEAMARPITENDIFELAKHLPEEKRKVLYATIADTIAEARIYRDREHSEKQAGN